MTATSLPARTATEAADSRRVRRRRAMARHALTALLLLPAIAGLCFLFLYPMAGIAVDSVTLPQAGTENYTKLFTDGYTFRILLRTFYVALLVAVITVVIAFPYAYLMTVRGPRWAAILMTVALIPFWSNATAKNFGLLVLFQRNGPVHKFTSVMGLDEPLIYTTAGVVIAMTQVLIPFAILPLFARLSQINRRLLDAAHGLGATKASAFWRIYAPLSIPGVAASFTLVSVLSLGFYITPAMLGSPQESLVAQLIMARLEIVLDFGGASAVGVFLLVTTVAILGLSQVLSSRLSRGSAQGHTAATARDVAGGVR